jgi:hypothetical protein
MSIVDERDRGVVGEEVVDPTQYPLVEEEEALERLADILFNELINARAEASLSESSKRTFIIIPPDANPLIEDDRTIIVKTVSENGVPARLSVYFRLKPNLLDLTSWAETVGTDEEIPTVINIARTREAVPSWGEGRAAAFFGGSRTIEVVMPEIVLSKNEPGWKIDTKTAVPEGCVGICLYEVISALANKDKAQVNPPSPTT